MTSAGDLEKTSNFVDMEFAFKGQLNDQYIVGIVTEYKKTGERYGILDP